MWRMPTSLLEVCSSVLKRPVCRKDNLCVVRVDDAHNAMTRGLRFECGNGDAFSHQQIHECGLANVGVSYDVDESCFVCWHCAHMTIFINADVLNLLGKAMSGIIGHIGRKVGSLGET